MNRHSKTVLATALVLSLSACGDGDDGGGGGLLAADPEPGSAEAVAAEARGEVRCPPRIATPAPAAGAPTVDVIGLRPGLTYDEAVNVVLCHHPRMVVEEERYRGFRVETAGGDYRRGFVGTFAQPASTLTPQQMMQQSLDEAAARSAGAAPDDDVLPGESKVYVATMGVSGEERVISASRRERFAAGEAPTIANLVAALTEKYGEPTYTGTWGDGRELRWAYDPTGRRILESSPYYSSCRAPADPDDGSNLSPDCGVVVQARIDPLRDNPELADSLAVGVIDQAGGFALIERTEQAFAAQDQARRAAEVARAAQTDAPTL